MHLYIYVSPEVISGKFWVFMVEAKNKTECFQIFKTLVGQE
jgi:hypothetical protein